MVNSGSVADPEDRPKGWGLKGDRDAVDTSLDLGPHRAYYCRFAVLTFESALSLQERTAVHVCTGRQRSFV